MESKHHLSKVFVIVLCLFPVHLCAFNRLSALWLQIPWGNPKNATPLVIDYRISAESITPESKPNRPWIFPEVQDAHKQIPSGAFAPTGTFSPSPPRTPSLASPTVTGTHSPPILPTRTQTGADPTTTPFVQLSRTPRKFTGKLLITEVLYDPLSADAMLEWIELFNQTSQITSLDPLFVGDEETPGQGEGMYAFPTGATVGGRNSILIAINGEAYYQAYGVYPSYEIQDSSPQVPNMIKNASWSGGSFALNNNGDEVILVDETNQVHDFVSWGECDANFNLNIPRVKPGHSLHRISGSSSSSRAQDWFELDDPNPGQEVFSLIPSRTPTDSPGRERKVSASKTPSNTPTQTGTATATATPTPTPTPTWTPTPTETATITATPLRRYGRLLITEAMNNPSASGLSIDEWVEVFNADVDPLDLSCSKIGDAENQMRSEGMYLFPPGAIIQPGQAIVISTWGQQFRDQYGRNPDFEIADTSADIPDMLPYRQWFYSPPFMVWWDLTETGDEIILLDDTDEMIDAVAWGKSAFFTDPASGAFHNPAVPVVNQGHSLERIPAGNDSNAKEDWLDQPNPSPGLVFFEIK